MMSVFRCLVLQCCVALFLHTPTPVTVVEAKKAAMFKSITNSASSRLAKFKKDVGFPFGADVGFPFGKDMAASIDFNH